MNAIKPLFVLFLISLAFGISACASNAQPSVYAQMGGQPKVEEVVDNFITEIEFDPVIFEYFTDTDVDRFREKLVEHVCHLTGGHCEYTGDTMARVHAGMNITETDFNRGVDLFINAMNKAQIPHPIQNKVLAILAKTRKEMIYL
ncbi:globin [Paraglaciecola sp. T6c]|uniref:group I truncated hemoglobin n=1 Tax=Pseudoalteromonas atlantica (strain T6c / ATCC BAA-1087) TaxID=3042615 RepID=UPI00005C59AB|nr:group 1 truncated hemoglobin [Paraglaciecola sp. T6c]ABG38786.1 globin [Paraglaciecola sp. T6c]